MRELTDINYVKNLLSKYGFRFSKTLGQNFLIDKQVPQRIAKEAEIEGAGVIEIGPGIGPLTRNLAEKAEKVVAVEIDKALLPVLSETLGDLSNVNVICGDVLKLDLHTIIKEYFPCMRVCVCANLPYYITTPVIMKLLESDLGVDSITVMIQKEVAQRLCAGSGGKDCGAITYATEYYCEPEMLFDVPPECFVPSPKVTSSVIRLQLRKVPPVSPKDVGLMFGIIKYAFAQRRKNILNAVYNGFSDKISKESVAAALKSAEINAAARGESLSLAKYAIFSDELSAYLS